MRVALWIFVGICALVACTVEARADSWNLEITGIVDPNSGAAIGGVDAPWGSPFVWNVGIKSTTTPGEYSVRYVNFTTVVGSYATTANWTVVFSVGVFSAPTFLMTTTPSPHQDPVTGEQLDMGLLTSLSLNITDPTTWDGAYGGDFFVRGPLGSANFNHLSGLGEYTGVVTLTVTPIPEPTCLALFGLGALGLAAHRRRRKRAAA